MKKLIGMLVIFSFLLWGCNSSINPWDLVRGDDDNKSRTDYIESEGSVPNELIVEEPGVDPSDPATSL